MIHFASLYVFYGAFFCAVVGSLYRWYFYQVPIYRFSATDAVVKLRKKKPFSPQKVLFLLRCSILLLIVFLLARPQKVDEKSQVLVEGIETMLVLDVSGSMQLFDDLNDQRQRIEVAKQEAIHFVNKRENDPIGLILFAQEAVSRCPTTLDKNMLISIIKDIELGVIAADGTMLSKGLLMALHRLHKTEAKSKIIIALTDGAPSEGDINPQAVIELANKYGVKIYTIGVGAEQAYYAHTFGIESVRSSFNKQLLHLLAQKTGGAFFEAKKPDDLKKIYNEIDRLEKTSYQTNVYKKYHDIFMPFLYFLLLMIIGECLLRYGIWRGVSV